jgi:hypothetical protein
MEEKGNNKTFCKGLINIMIILATLYVCESVKADTLYTEQN